MNKPNSDSPSSGTADGTSLDACDASAAMCCSQFYEQDIVQELMGGSFHPGGEALSKTLVSELSLSAGAKVLDVACGVGTTTRMMATQFGFDATGLDFSEINIQKARSMVGAVAEQSEPCCAPGDSCCPPPSELIQLGDQVQTESAWVQGASSGTCLLYTSPSPRDATLSRMPSSA